MSTETSVINEPHILIVDDDEGIRSLLSKFLLQHGYTTSIAKDGREMYSFLQKNEVDLIILDIMLPGDDGLTLCRQLRSQSHVPIIMLTAVSEEVDRILGLEMGADDYLGKPINPRELLARVRAILRRAKQENTSLVQHIKREHILYHFEGWTLDKTSRRVTSPDRMEVTLSSGEFDLLLALVQHPQQVLSRDKLLDLTKNRLAGPFDRSIDIQISRLRHKIEKDHKKPRLIKTVRGGGYVLAANVVCEQK